MTLGKSTTDVRDSQKTEPPAVQEDARNARLLEHRRAVLASSGPFEHRNFKLPSNADPPNSPAAVEALVQFNELELSKWTSKRPRFQNLMEGEKDTLQDLRSRCDIVIKPAEPLSAVVIMDIGDYLMEGLCQLEDRNFYQPTDTDLTLDHNLIVSDAIDTMFDKGEISADTAEYLRQR